jgi:Tfp pilus assembly protein PilN
MKEFLTQQLPDQEVNYLIAPRLDTRNLSAEDQDMISEYAVPLGTACRVLQPENPELYSINLLPSSIQEGQRTLKLAWHGYTFLAFLFFSALFFSMSISKKSKEIAELESVLRLKQTQIAEVEALQSSIIDLEQQLAKYQTSLALYDSIVPGSDRWSKTFAQLSHGVEDLNSIWISDLSSDGNGVVTMSGYSIYRTRIPRMATLFDVSLLKEVTVQEIRDVELYQYLLEVPATQSGQTQ